MLSTSKAYRDAVISLIATIEEQEKQSIDRCSGFGQVVAEDRLIHVIGRADTPIMAVEEVLWREEGLAPINAILDAGTNLIHGAKRSNLSERTPGYAKGVLDAYEVNSGDVLVIVNAYGINAMTIDCALEQRRGGNSIAITSTSLPSCPKNAASRHPSGQNLYELVDIFIDNHLPLGDAVVEVDGLEQRMGPTSTFANSFTINLLMIRTAEKLLEMGIQPPIWTSANLPDGDRLNRKYEREYFPRVKHLR